MTYINEALNEYGVPLSACNGYRHDEHYWAYVRAVRVPLMALYTPTLHTA